MCCESITFFGQCDSLSDSGVISNEQISPCWLCSRSVHNWSHYFFKTCVITLVQSNSHLLFRKKYGEIWNSGSRLLCETGTSSDSMAESSGNTVAEAFKCLVSYLAYINLYLHSTTAVQAFFAHLTCPRLTLSETDCNKDFMRPILHNVPCIKPTRSLLLGSVWI